jgi:beta-lactam-binding protein with PASTA domain
MKSFFKYTAIFGIGFIAAGAIAYYSVRLFTQSADEVVLPQLKGKNILYVLETLTNMGLNAKLYGTEYDDSIPVYSVISQDPLPGATIKKGRDVIIYISKGPQQIIIPDLRHLTINTALLALEKNGFKVGHISYTFSDHTRKDQVIAQYPHPFSNASKGQVFNLLISKGLQASGIAMPDLSGLDMNSAYTLIQSHQLTLGSVTSRFHKNKTIGRIIGQKPDPGHYVTGLNPIELVVNDVRQNQTFQPQKLKGVRLVSYRLPPGFLKKHVRVESDLFGPVLTLYDEFMKPEEEISLLIPGGIKTQIDIYIDHNFFKTITIDPWSDTPGAGEDLLWESLPPLSYPLILHNLETS